MIQIGKAIVSLDIFEKHFLCDLKKCKGVCCVDGDSGAPLTEDEARLIEENYPAFSKYLAKKHRDIVAEKGYSIIDGDGDLVTPIFNKEECVYTFIDENGITKCAIERAYFEGKSNFRKPVSCHLFPIRISEYKDFDAVNYQQLDICKPGRICGQRQNLPLYKFLKEPLIRKYGSDWYKELEIAAGLLKK
jgi:hypothetical protein